jgi:hypothetical protein
MAEAFREEITKLYEAREQEREARKLKSVLSPQRGPRFSDLSLERFRTATKYADRPRRRCQRLTHVACPRIGLLVPLRTTTSPAILVLQSDPST